MSDVKCWKTEEGKWIHRLCNLCKKIVEYRDSDGEQAFSETNPIAVQFLAFIAKFEDPRYEPDYHADAFYEALSPFEADMLDGYEDEENGWLLKKTVSIKFKNNKGVLIDKVTFRLSAFYLKSITLAKAAEKQIQKLPSDHPLTQKRYEIHWPNKIKLYIYSFMALKTKNEATKKVFLNYAKQLATLTNFKETELSQQEQTGMGNHANMAMNMINDLVEKMNATGEQMPESGQVMDDLRKICTSGTMLNILRQLESGKVSGDINEMFLKAVNGDSEMRTAMERLMPPELRDEMLRSTATVNEITSGSSST